MSKELNRAVLANLKAAYLNLGMALRDAGMANKALRAFRDALELDPDYAVAHFGLGTVLSEQAQRARKREKTRSLREQAVDALQHAVELDPGYVEACQLLATVLGDLGRNEEQVGWLEKAVEHDPDNLLAWQTLGAAYRSQGQLLDKAVEAYEKTVELAPQEAEFLRSLASVHYDLNHWAEAAELYDRAFAIEEGKAKDYNSWGGALYHLGKYEEGLHAIQKAIELEPEAAGYHSNEALFLLGLKRYEEAEMAYRKAIELDPDFAMAHNNLGSLLSDLEHYEEAEAAYRKAIELDPKYAMAHNHLGNLLAVLERYEEAEAACAKAIELNPEYADAYVDQGRILYLQNKISQCIEAFRKAIEVEPDNPTAHNNLGFVLGGQGENYDESIRELTHALELGHTPSITYNNLGYIFLRRKECARAEDSLEDALEEDQGETAILRVAFYQNTYVLIDEDPFPKEFLSEEAVAYCNLATVFAEQGHMDLALEMGKEAIESCPESPLGYRAIGHIYLEMDDFNRALEAFNKALELDSENEEIHKLIEFAKSKASE